MINIIKHSVIAISLITLTSQAINAQEAMTLPVPNSAYQEGQAQISRQPTSPLSNSNPSLSQGQHSFNRLDANSTNISKIGFNKAVTVTNQYGKSKIVGVVAGKDINATNPQSMLGYVRNLQKNEPSKTLSFLSNFQTDLNGTKKFNYNDMSSFTNKALEKAYDANSTIVRGITTIHNFKIKATSLVANLKTIQCYVTRKLVNSFYCPLPSKNQSYFVGGSYADSQSADLRKCNNLCRVPEKCLYKKMYKPLNSNIATNKPINQETTIKFSTDSDMMARDLQLNFTATYQYDSNISVTSKKYNPKIADSDLNSTRDHFMNINLAYLDPTSNTYKVVFSHYRIKFFHTQAKAMLYFSGIPSHRFKLTLYKPYLQDNNSSIVSATKLKVNLKLAQINYVDNKYWFCPATQFVTSKSACPGTLKIIGIGSQTYSVCVTQSGLAREPKYGAYYTQSSCSDKCFISAKCVPTYRQINNLSTVTNNDSYSDVVVGCTKAPFNTSCTKALCMKLFQEDTMPIKERTWTANGTSKYTVLNGAPVPHTIRPRFDINQAISANGNAKARAIANIKEMSEISYHNMINNHNYDVSSYEIGQDIPRELAYGNEAIGGYSNAIYLKLRPNSYAINNGIKYNVYLLFKISSNFHPDSGAYTGPNNTIITGAADSRFLIMDQAYVLKTPNGFQTIARTNNAKFYVCTNPNANINDLSSCKHGWVTISSYVHTYDNMYSERGPLAYNLNSFAPVSYKAIFTNQNSYTPFMAFNSLNSIASTKGVLFNHQSTNSNTLQRIYSGAITNTGSRLYQITGYAIYSAHRLTYKELLNDFTSKNKFYSSYQSMSKTIDDSSASQLNNIKMFIGGTPNNISVLNYFKPTTAEENKRSFIYMLLY